MTMMPPRGSAVAAFILTQVFFLSSRELRPVSAWMTTTTSSVQHHYATATSTAEEVSPIMAAFEAETKGREALGRGSTNAAVFHYTSAVEHNPTPERYFRLGHALEENGESMPAIEAFDKAKSLTNDKNLIRDANLKLAHLWGEHLGDNAGGLYHADAAMTIEEDAVVIDQKAFFLAASGDYQGAIDLWDKALALKDAGRGDMVNDDAKLYRAIAKDVIGRGYEGQADLNTMNIEEPHKVDSWRYVMNHPPTTQAEYWKPRLFSGTATLLYDALCAARPDGLICEFGVFHGKSIRLLASMVGPNVPVDGFDTFEGIPEDWGDEPAGSYTAANEVPERCPTNVRFHVGLFADTLPGYVQDVVEPPETMPVRLINVDCDLYQGTVEIMHYLAPRIGPGTVIVFDEYLMTPTWIDDEYKAFQEACAKFGWKYEYLAYSLFSKQAVVRITESSSFVGPKAA